MYRQIAAVDERDLSALIVRGAVMDTQETIIYSRS